LKKKSSVPGMEEQRDNSPTVTNLRKRLIMLWTMLNVICFLVCIIGAAGAAREAKAGLIGYALALIIGLAIGGSSAWAMQSVGERVGAATQAHPAARRELCFKVLYVVAVLWIIIALFIADHLTSAAMRLAA
jgi:hypothetical protein